MWKEFALSCHDEGGVWLEAVDALCDFEEAFWAFLLGESSDEQDFFLSLDVSWPFFFLFCSEVDDAYFFLVYRIVFEDDPLGVFAVCEDEVCCEESFAFNCYDSGVGAVDCSVEFCGVHLEDEWFFCGFFEVNSCLKGHPVMGVDKVKVFVGCEPFYCEGEAVHFREKVLAVGSVVF